MREEFGDVYSGVLVRDHWLASLGGTAQDALDRGVPARDVWVAKIFKFRCTAVTGGGFAIRR